MFDVRRDLMQRLEPRQGARLARAEIRRRALRAATAVAAGAAVVGCGSADLPVSGATTVLDGGANDGGGAIDGNGAIDGGLAHADSGGAPDAAQPDTAQVDTAQTDTATADTGAADTAQADTGTADTAQADTADRPVCDSSLGWERYKKCCDEVNWDFHKGCMAWGPPAPPQGASVAELLRGMEVA